MSSVQIVEGVTIIVFVTVVLLAMLGGWTELLRWADEWRTRDRWPIVADAAPPSMVRILPRGERPFDWTRDDVSMPVPGAALTASELYDLCGIPPELRETCDA